MTRFYFTVSKSCSNEKCMMLLRSFRKAEMCTTAAGILTISNFLHGHKMLTFILILKAWNSFKTNDHAETESTNMQSYLYEGRALVSSVTMKVNECLYHRSAFAEIDEIFKTTETTVSTVIRSWFPASRF